MSARGDSWGLIGPDSPIDQLLAEYFGELPEGWVYEAFESEQSALLAALLIEQQGGSTSQESESNAEAVYYSSGESGLTVTTNEQSESWDFTATSVVVWGWSEDILVSFKGPNRTDREIPLAASRESLSLDVRTSEVWYRRQSSATADTNINVLAVVDS